MAVGGLHQAGEPLESQMPVTDWPFAGTHVCRQPGAYQFTAKSPGRLANAINLRFIRVVICVVLIFKISILHN
jgi:hypothetical protein